MKKHPKVFDALYTNMIAAGEAGGILDGILKRLATYIEKAVKLKSQVKSAMIYPIAVIVIAAVVVAVILWKVIPTFAPCSPAWARAAAADAHRHRLSNFLVRFMPFILVGHRRGRLRLQALLRDRAAAACRSTGSAEGADHGADPAQDRRRAVLPHAVHAARLGRADPRRPRHHGAHGRQRDGREGHLTPRRASSAARHRRAARRDGVFPPMVVQMIGVGEATGALDTMLSKIADFYEEEVDLAVAGMLTLLEPVMIAFLGVVVGGIVIAMYLPIFEPNQPIVELMTGTLGVTAPHATACRRGRRRCRRGCGRHAGACTGRVRGQSVLRAHCRRLRREPGLHRHAALCRRAPWLADVQFAIDTVMVTAVVAITGGVTSLFTSLYVLPIVAASGASTRCAAPCRFSSLGSVLYSAR